MNVAVIPARGGSKRIPRKNVRHFGGKPMVTYAIEAARRSASIDRILVSTDDDEIAAVAAGAGAEVPFRRPADISGDHAGTTEVVAHAIEWLRSEGVAELGAVCCVYATAPFVRARDIDSGYRRLRDGSWTYVFAATTFEAPVHRALTVRPDGGLDMMFPEHFLTRSQDLPEVLHDAGQFYWGRPGAWASLECIFSETSTVVSIPRWRVQDIDTEEDWHRAEAMLTYVTDQ